MTAQEELLLAAEALAEAVDDYREAIAYPPERSDYDEGETGDEQFCFAREFFQEDLAEAWDTLARALRNYRWAQQREPSERSLHRLASSV